MATGNYLIPLLVLLELVLVNLVILVLVILIRAILQCLFKDEKFVFFIIRIILNAYFVSKNFVQKLFQARMARQVISFIAISVI